MDLSVYFSLPGLPLQGLGVGAIRRVVGRYPFEPPQAYLDILTHAGASLELLLAGVEPGAEIIVDPNDMATVAAQYGFHVSGPRRKAVWICLGTFALVSFVSGEEALASAEEHWKVGLFEGDEVVKVLPGSMSTWLKCELLTAWARAAGLCGVWGEIHPSAASELVAMLDTRGFRPLERDEGVVLMATGVPLPCGDGLPSREGPPNIVITSPSEPEVVSVEFWYTQELDPVYTDVLGELYELR